MPLIPKCISSFKLKRRYDRNRHILQENSRYDVHSNVSKGWNQYFVRESCFSQH